MTSKPKEKSNYRLELKFFCENCPNFEVLDDCTSYQTNVYDKPTKYVHHITCKNMEMCLNIYRRILMMEKEKQKEDTDG